MSGPDDAPQDVNVEERVGAGTVVDAPTDAKGQGGDIAADGDVMRMPSGAASSASKSLHVASYEGGDEGEGEYDEGSEGSRSTRHGSDAQSNATGTSVEDDDDDDDDDDESSSCSVYESDDVVLLGEIVSGFRLTRHDPADDVGGSDSRSDDGTRRVFCRVRYGSESIHKTDCAKDAGSSWRNPIWTLSTRSLFVIRTTPRELAHTDAVVSAWFQRKDPLILTNETCYLGEAKLSGTDLVRGATEEHVHSLTLHDGRCHKALDSLDRMPRGTLNVRFRLATPADEAIVKLFHSPPSAAALAKPGCFDLYKVLHALPFGSDAPESIGTPEAAVGSVEHKNSEASIRPVYKVITEKDEAHIATSNFVRSLSDALLMVSSAADPFHQGGSSSRTTTQPNKIRVKPHPDPRRAKETAWMSPDEIKAEVLKPSHAWLEAGSGTLGKLYLEVRGWVALRVCSASRLLLL
jgi:hypothetical protein